MIQDLLQATSAVVMNGISYPASRLEVVKGVVHFQAVMPFPDAFAFIPNEALIHISANGLERKIALEDITRITARATQTHECFIDVEAVEKGKENFYET